MIDKRNECVIDFYLLIDTIDINQIRFTEFYRFFDCKIDTDFYQLTTPEYFCRRESRQKLRPLPEPIRLHDLQNSARSRRVCLSGEGRRWVQKISKLLEEIISGQIISVRRNVAFKSNPTTVL